MKGKQGFSHKNSFLPIRRWKCLHIPRGKLGIVVLRVRQRLENLQPPPSIIRFVFTILGIHGIHFSIGPALREQGGNEKVRKDINYLFSVFGNDIEFVACLGHARGRVTPSPVSAQILFEFIFFRVGLGPKKTTVCEVGYQIYYVNGLVYILANKWTN